MSAGAVRPVTAPQRPPSTASPYVPARVSSGSGGRPPSSFTARSRSRSTVSTSSTRFSTSPATA
eukprot:3272466-Pleurochrysis_carterae.AAC.1